MSNTVEIDYGDNGELLAVVLDMDGRALTYARSIQHMFNTRIRDGVMQLVNEPFDVRGKRCGVGVELAICTEAGAIACRRPLLGQQDHPAVTPSPLISPEILTTIAAGVLEFSLR